MIVKLENLEINGSYINILNKGETIHQIEVKDIFTILLSSDRFNINCFLSEFLNSIEINKKK